MKNRDLLMNRVDDLEEAYGRLYFGCDAEAVYWNAYFIGDTLTTSAIDRLGARLLRKANIYRERYWRALWNA